MIISGVGLSTGLKILVVGRHLKLTVSTIKFASALPHWSLARVAGGAGAKRNPLQVSVIIVC
jgi:hypothetical protein